MPRGDSSLVEAVIEDGRWNDVDIEATAERCCRAALRHFRMDPENFEIGMLACDDIRMAQLNAVFRDIPEPTNVLSWPAGPGRGEPEEAESRAFLGDIAISWSTCIREAERDAKDLSGHVEHLIVHGCLHLLGYDHGCESDAEIMEAHEADILATVGAGRTCQLP